MSEENVELARSVAEMFQPEGVQWISGADHRQGRQARPRAVEGRSKAVQDGQGEVQEGLGILVEPRRQPSSRGPTSAVRWFPSRGWSCPFRGSLCPSRGLPSRGELSTSPFRGRCALRAGSLRAGGCRPALSAGRCALRAGGSGLLGQRRLEPAHIGHERTIQLAHIPALNSPAAARRGPCRAGRGLDSSAAPRAPSGPHRAIRPHASAQPPTASSSHPPTHARAPAFSSLLAWALLTLGTTRVYGRPHDTASEAPGRSSTKRSRPRSRRHCVEGRRSMRTEISPLAEKRRFRKSHLSVSGSRTRCPGTRRPGASLPPRSAGPGPIPSTQRALVCRAPASSLCRAARQPG